MSSNATQLTLEVLRQAIAGQAAAIRCRTRLQPAGGEGTKVFPPTHAGGVYATEKRRVPIYDESNPKKIIGTREADCVLLDSVQSQANRIEDALQAEIDSGELKMPLIEVDFRNIEGIADVQRVTSLQAPHRAADAILRDSVTRDDNGKPVPFRRSAIGDAITNSSLANATGMFCYCPHALFLGVWDSTGPKGGLGAKFARALVSEIVGIDAVYGVRTGSRIDPVQIAKAAGPLFRKPDGTWTISATDAIKEMKEGQPTGKVVLYKKDSKGKDILFDPTKQAGEVPDAGKPSSANHGNVTPDLVRYQDSVEALGIKKNDIARGGVTIAHAEHTAVLSLAQLRRLRFPIGKLPEDKTEAEVDNAARTVLAALALLGLTLSLERGTDLRSRCLLVLEDSITFELLDVKDGKSVRTPITLNSKQAMAIYNDAVRNAIDLLLPWHATSSLVPNREEFESIKLNPSVDLVALVNKSQDLAKAGVDEQGGAAS